MSEQLKSKMPVVVRRISVLYACGLILLGTVRTGSAGCCCLKSHYQVLASCIILEFKGNYHRGECISYKFR